MPETVPHIGDTMVIKWSKMNIFTEMTFQCVERTTNKIK